MIEFKYGLLSYISEALCHCIMYGWVYLNFHIVDQPIVRDYEFLWQYRWTI